MKIINSNNYMATVPKTTFKKNNKENVQKYLDKYNYLEAKTQNLRELSVVFLILSLFLDIHNIDFTKKLSNRQKFGCLTALGCITSFTYTCIKKMQLSKQYDKEKNYDTKNYA